MKSFKEFLTESKAFKKGDKVKIKNVKSYDSMAKSDVGTVIDFMNKDTVMVKVGSGQMNVDLKDLQLSESTETNINEAKTKYPHPQKDIDAAKTDVSALEGYGEAYAKKKWDVDQVIKSMDQLGLNASEKAIVIRAYFPNVK